MDGLGLLVVVSFVILTIAIVTNTCVNWSFKEGFSASSPLEESKKGPSIPRAEVAGPAPKNLLTGAPPTDIGKVTGYTNVAELPSAPINGLAENNALPYQDPASQKGSNQMLMELKADMDGFSASELPGLKSVGKSDPSVTLPISRFKGDYQRVKDEVATLKNSPGLQSQLGVDDIQDMASNLRFLQRQYRTYSNSNMVGKPHAGLSSVGLEGAAGAGVEGFAASARTGGVEGFAADPLEAPITSDQLDTLSTKLSVEIARLLASGATDPVIVARTSAYTKIRQSVDDLRARVKNGTLKATDIPIKLKDYQNFLPALGSNSAGIAGLLSKTGNATLSSLFNSYDTGDVSGADVAAALFQTYADDLLKGLSYNVTVSYTSPNDVSKEQAISSAWNAKNAFASLSNGVTGSASSASSLVSGGITDGFSGSGESRGEFEQKINTLSRPPSKAPSTAGHFDWKTRVDAITENIRRAGMDPGDFGCLERGAQVSQDYSWRGHAKMVCSRLATNADPAIPEQMGCPPVSWKGWRM